MLDDFKDNSFYNYAINLTKYYHAYILEVDDVENNMPLIMAFSKMIICENHYSNNTKCSDCNICHLIDENAYSDLKIIEPDGSSIKKEQVLTLQKELSLKSVTDNNQVYIIKYADKMNASASNSLLKFIEEPEDGIYGILVTTNKNDLLETIISRCILISLKQKRESYSLEEVTNIVNFINLVYRERELSLPYVKSLFLNFYPTREEIIKAFNVMEVIIDYLLTKKYNINTSLDDEVCDIIKQKLSNLSELSLINGLEKIVVYKNKLINNINLNINLFMDRFIIEISEVIV